MSSEETQTWIAYGDHAYNQGNYPDALSFYTQAYHLDPTNVTILSKLGNTYFSLQQPTVAEDFYLQALTNSNAITLVYDYLFTPPQNQNFPLLQTSLQDTYHLSITIDGLVYLLTVITQDLQHHPPIPPHNQQLANHLKTFVTTLLHSAGIPILPNLIEFADQLQHAVSTPTPNRYPLTLSKRMGWKQFEDFFYHFFQHQGYQVKRTPYSNDKGIDLLLRNNTEFIGVQLKKRTKPVGVKAVQETCAGAAFYETTRALLISSSGFTRYALQLAQKVGVECWDWQQIVRNFPPASTLQQKTE